MSDIIEIVIVSLLQNFTLTLFIVGLVFASAAIARAPRPVTRAVIIDRITAWFIFFSIGAGYFYNFVMHGFFGQMTAHFIGWADSPFQRELAAASLGFSAVGFFAAFRGFDARCAAIAGPAIFTLGAAVVHMQEMITAHNFAPGNAGVIFWTDIVGPLFGFALLWLQRPGKHARAP